MRIIFFVLVIGFACTTKDKTQSKISDSNDNALIDAQIHGFLRWYSANWDTLNVDLLNPIIDNSLQSFPDSTKPYKINYDNAEIYLNQFRQSGYISDSYINSFRDYFKQCQKEFEITPQFDGPPYGFEFDFVFRSQMYDYEKKSPDSARVTDISIEGDKAKASVKYFEEYFYYYQLTKTNDKWLIDNIKATYEK